MSNPARTNARVLVFDDEPDVGAFLREVARRSGFDAFAADNEDDFWLHLDVIDPGMIFLDLKMPRVDGVEVLRTLAQRRCRAHIVLISGADSRVLQTAVTMGNDSGLSMLGSLQKPIELTVLREFLEGISASVMPPGVNELRKAIDANEIIAHYQPKVGLATERPWKISGCEALARWDHPERGLLGPDTFIAVAEEADLIGPLTDAILRQAVARLSAWRSQGFPLTIAVNVSPLLFADVTLPDRFNDTCRSHDVDPAWVTLEVTESGAMKDVSVTADILTRFRLKGFGVSIDDFGTGYSSLVQLHRMPFNEMKIDKSFVIESDGNQEAVQIIRAIAGLAHSLNLRLCAEGVESDKALALVREVGCHVAQGFLIGKPMPADDLEHMLGEA